MARRFLRAFVATAVLSAAAFLPLPTAVQSAAPARAQDHAAAPVTRSPEAPLSEPSLGREAHSDGGYWYWLEQHPDGR